MQDDDAPSFSPDDQTIALASEQISLPPTGSKPAPGLYLVATPIGNLEDITLRALRLLRHADVIACEDSRMTGKLLTLLGLGGKPLLPYHDHNDDRARPRLLEHLRKGAVVALVSDAGMPLISDPGYPLVRDCVAAGMTVTSVPGASAPLLALQLSGLPSERFTFAGFLPAKSAARRAALAEMVGWPTTLVFLESPHRLGECLADLLTILGDRPAAVARELTKLHEDVRRARLAVLAAHYAEDGRARGEVVLVVGGADPDQTAPAQNLDDLLRDALTRHSPRDAAAVVAAATGQPKRLVYARLLEMRHADQTDRDEESA